MSSQTREDPVSAVILGAGVIGLTIAHVLTANEQGGLFKVTVIAKDFPEDIDSQGFASPWAGANWSPMFHEPEQGEKLTRWERRTVEKLREMIPLGLALDLPSRLYFDFEPSQEKLQCEGIAQHFHVSDVSLPDYPELKFMAELNTVSINPHVYLPMLKSQLESRGVIFKRQRVASLDEACQATDRGGIVVNASSLGARSLAGVEDTKIYPIRGQSILLHAPSVNHFVSVYHATRSSDEVLYVIPRPAPTGEALLGGTYQVNDWNLSVDWNIAKRMLESAKKLVPELSDPGVYIKYHNVGLRPARHGGPRLEVATHTWPKLDELAPGIPQAEQRETLVLHAYGFSGYGFQTSWGAAEEGVQLLKKALLR